MTSTSTSSSALRTMKRLAAATAGASALCLGAPALAADKGLTREQVKAELAVALAKGEVHISDVDYPKWPEFKSTKTREQVKQELALATAQGEVYFSDVNYPPATQVATAPVKAPDVAKTIKQVQETVVAWVKKAASLI